LQNERRTASPERFLEYLEKLRLGETWGRARAVFRRSLAFPPGTYTPSFPFVEPFVGQQEGWTREAFYLTAGLYGLKDGEHQPGRHFARALRETMEVRKSASIEKRFLALLDADRDQLPTRLRLTLGLIEGGIDFVSLLRDLLAWFDFERDVQVRWAREFYREIKEVEDETS